MKKELIAQFGEALFILDMLKFGPPSMNGRQSYNGTVSSEQRDVLYSMEELHKALIDADTEWVCTYPEFNDPACYPGHPNPQPESARQPRKHTTCGWHLLIPLDKETK